MMVWGACLDGVGACLNKVGPLLVCIVGGALFSGFEGEGRAVDAEPLACGVRAVFKHMTKVGITLQHTHTHR